jgi:hypothetical protein
MWNHTQTYTDSLWSFHNEKCFITFAYPLSLGVKGILFSFAFPLWKFKGTESPDEYIFEGLKKNLVPVHAQMYFLNLFNLPCSKEK